MGIALILCVTVIWVASSEWIQHIFGELDFEKPYFLTYFNTTGFCFWNLGYLISEKWSRVPHDERTLEQPIFIEDIDLVTESPEEMREREHNDARERVLRKEARRNKFAIQRIQDFFMECNDDGEALDNFDECSSREQSDVEDGQRVRVERVRLYSVRKIWRCAMLFCPLWFFANYLFNVSLSMTSVSSNTILSSTSSVWTLVLSYVALRQPISEGRILGVLLCVGGTIMVGVSDRNSGTGKESLWGDLLALVSAVFYASYTTVLKWCLPEDERFSMGMVFGAVGVINFLFFWPGLLVVHALGWERLRFPSWGQFWPLFLNALIGTNLSDVLWARSVVLTSPVIATLGLSLTTPLSMVVDAVFKNSSFSAVYIVGGVMVMCGFALANVDFNPVLLLRSYWRG